MPQSAPPEGEAFSGFPAGDEYPDAVEAAIEDAYRRCFRTFIVGGRVLTLRMPFGQNNERSELAEVDLEVLGGGKADPESLWERIEALIATEDFAAYAAALGDGREKAVAFDLAARSWTTTRDIFDVARLKAGSYPGLPHKPYVLSAGKGVDAAALYDYVYCVGRMGMDCSGFVWHVLSTVAARGRVDLARTLRRSLRAPNPGSSSLYFGTWFFDARNKEVQVVADRVDAVRPLDVLIFRDESGDAVHSAVVQSVDLEAGRIRYLQSTDEAPPAERGVHESFILFDPSKPGTSLKDPSLAWTQVRRPPFTGERKSDFPDDGARYRAFPEAGGGAVMRVKALAAPAARLRKAAR